MSVYNPYKISSVLGLLL